MGAHYEEDPRPEMEGGDGRVLRRGAWTREEDLLLKSCIQMYGEGKWNLVPCRAGLNRCRKSCRLRWLNYLRPNINREKFTWDEVDLMIRLKKLLGNRWSLIAGRLPGRTANDVKNYWNTHLLKKTTNPSSPTKLKKWSNLDNAGNSSNRDTIIPKPRVLKPRPRRFKENLPLCFNLKVPPSTDPTPASTGFGAGNCQAAPPPPENIDISWWESLLFSEETTTQHQQQPLYSSNFVEESAGTEMLAVEAAEWNCLLEEEQMGWNTDLSFSDLELQSFSTP